MRKNLFPSTEPLKHTGKLLSGTIAWLPALNRTLKKTKSLRLLFLHRLPLLDLLLLSIMKKFDKSMWKNCQRLNFLEFSSTGMKSIFSLLAFDMTSKKIETWFPSKVILSRLISIFYSSCLIDQEKEVRCKKRKKIVIITTTEKKKNIILPFPRLALATFWMFNEFIRKSNFNILPNSYRIKFLNFFFFLYIFSYFRWSFTVIFLGTGEFL